MESSAALGIAIVSTVAVSRSEDYLAANEGANPLVGLTDCYPSAFLGLRRPSRDRPGAGTRLPGPASEGTRTSGWSRLRRPLGIGELAKRLVALKLAPAPAWAASRPERIRRSVLALGGVSTGEHP